MLTHPTRLGLAVHVAAWILAAVIGVAIADPSEFRAPPLTLPQIDAALLRWTDVAPRHPLRRESYRSEVADAVHRHAEANGLDPALVLAVIMRESSGRDSVTGPAGELGLMQVHPLTAVRWRCRLETVDQQVACGCRILCHWHRVCRGSEHGALSAYGSRAGTCTPRPGGSVDKMANDRVSLARRIRMEAAHGR